MQAAAIDLVKRIATENRRHASAVTRALAALSPRERDDLDGYVSHCLAEGASVERLAADYKLVIDDTLREQVYFWRHGRYRHARYEDVAGAVYLDPAYMTAYMRGLALTAFFWPNHASIRRWFAEALSRATGERYLEVGPGHGFYLLTALRSRAFTRCEAVDISPTSAALTERLLAAHGYPEVRVRVGDFLSVDPGGPFDVLVMGEVLEHVEDPGRFLARARALTSASAQIFVTTCIDSPAYDHIYLFRSVEEIETLAEEAGLAVVDQLILPYEGKTLAESQEMRLPINVALVLRHA